MDFEKAEKACRHAIRTKSRVSSEEESAIANHPHLSYIYAEALHCQFPEGEDAIAKSAYYSFQYAISIIGKRFIKGERIILSSGFSYIYKKYFGLDSASANWIKEGF